MLPLLIGPDQHRSLWAVLLTAAALGLVVDRTRFGARVSGAVVSIVITAALSNLGAIPADPDLPVYDTVTTYLVPLAVPLILLKADLRRIVRQTGPTLLAYAVGALATIVGVVVGFHLTPLGPEGWKLGGIYCAGYIGGTINFYAVAEAFGLKKSSSLVVAAYAADNLVMTLYFFLIFSLPSIGLIRRWFPPRSPPAAVPDPRRRVDHDPAGGDPVPDLSGMGLALALASVLCAAGYGLASELGHTDWGILLVTVMIVALATLAPGRIGSLGGGRELGMLFLYIFFATVGATANIPVVVRLGPIYLAYAAIIVAIHLALILVAGYFLRLDLSEILIASNAAIGGPSTAAAMATSLRWFSLVTPGILSGTLGYATATLIGVAIGRWLHSM
jgi:uncharacterized membrane protein